MLRLAALVAAVLLLAGCAAPTPEAEPEPTTEPGIFSHDGLDRTYLFTPAAEDDAALVVMLHGGGDTAVDARRDYLWEDIAMSEDFAVVYPDGIGGSWNAGGCCDPAAEDGVDDVAFLTALVSELLATQPINPARVYVTGFSNGGLMAYRLACETDLFAAIAPVGATLVSACDDPAPVSVLSIHGGGDKVVPLSGQIPQGTSYVNGMAIEELGAFWRTVDGCAEPATDTIGDVTTTSAECPDGRAVDLITVAGAGHQWPGSLVLVSGNDATSDAIDATATIWSFFDRH